MPAMLRQGSKGLDVTLLQAQLNLGIPDKKPLALDGKFGPLTNARVIEFQKSAQLSPDGIVGPKTWAALALVASGADKPSRFSCDNGSPDNVAKAGTFAAALRGGSLNGGFAFAGRTGGGATTTSSLVSVAGVSIQPFVGNPHEAAARAIYGSSLHYDRIFTSNKTGGGGRPFTLAVPVPPLVIEALPLGGNIVILNLGTTFREVDVIHELAHAWQSQHHSAPAQYMANCVACQAAAVAANTKLVAVDPRVVFRKNFPVNAPFSAYNYRRGLPFAAYAGEQIAQQVEKNEAVIRTKIASVAAGVVDSDNVKSLNSFNICIEDERAAGVFG